MSEQLGERQLPKPKVARSNRAGSACKNDRVATRGRFGDVPEPPIVPTYPISEDRIRACARAGHKQLVYLITSDDHWPACKIGRASDPWRRKRELQAACLSELHVVAVIVTSRNASGPAVEQTLHREFDALGWRVRGEWFRDPGWGLFQEIIFRSMAGNSDFAERIVREGIQALTFECGSHPLDRIGTEQSVERRAAEMRGVA